MGKNSVPQQHCRRKTPNFHTRTKLRVALVPVQSI